MNLSRTVAKMQKKAFLGALSAHHKIYLGSGGRIGHSILGVPTLIIHHVGAKTGQPRDTSLNYERDGDSYIVVASNGGAPRHPAWYHNIKAAGQVEINVKTDRFPVKVHTYLPGDPDYDRLFALADKKNSGRYTAYQRKTTRSLPVIALTPM